ncbi:Small heat shock protein, chloroplastic [Apostasia shenzhenica]|uniref:Small heat shock protein, chloroplastic n=1 Tax=Apostasia shenzhenica TaxID=1088818 RepID=A0A2I0A5G8_9ASPA|nr:Small heat shock protein, chloroplastic [Apostasia shenzhenica]
MALMGGFARRAAVSNALSKLLASPARLLVAAPAARFFNTNAELRESDDGREIDVDLRPDGRDIARRGADGLPLFFSDAMDPFVPRTVSQLLNMMDSMLDGPFTSAARGGTGGTRRGWEAREDGDALYLRIDMPGLGKESVKVTAEHGTLVIKGEGELEEGEEENRRRYVTRIDLAPEMYRLDQIRAEMKNGVLKVVVPKVKEEERKDVFHVHIE